VLWNGGFAAYGKIVIFFLLWDDFTTFGYILIFFCLENLGSSLRQLHSEVKWEDEI
jgi:hypothetical protein